MIADQRQLAAGQGEAAHPVGRIGHGAAVAHRLATFGQDPVGKPAWQIDQSVWIGHQWAVACGTVNCLAPGLAARRGQGAKREAGGG